jgi:hypothetical protein
MRSPRISRVFAAWALASAAACAPSAGGARLTTLAALTASLAPRSPVSYNERPFQPGKYGEEILANSAD